MMKNYWKFLLLVAGITGVLYFAIDVYEARMASLPYYGPQQEMNGEIVYHQIPEFSMLNQEGRRVGETELMGNVSVVNFFFTSCPTICPSMMRNMQTVQDLYRDQAGVSLMSFTVDPQRDDVNRLANYGQAYNVDPQRWNLVTGDKREIYGLARTGFYLNASEGDGGPHDFIHSESLVLVDQNGHIRGYYEGTDTKSVDKLIKAIAKLKRVKS